MGFSNYYQKEIERYGGNKKYVLAKAKEKQPLLSRIKKYANNKKIIEAGAGSSSNSIYLANEGYDVTCLELDNNMIDLAKDISKSFPKQPRYLNKDIMDFKEKNFSVCFSHGVLEHFDNKKTIGLINKQLEFSDYLIFSIPSDFFKQRQAINGDERFLSAKQWKEIISLSNGRIIESFSYFYDPDSFKLWILKLLSKLTFGGLPIKKPYLGFVVKKNVYNT